MRFGEHAEQFQNKFTQAENQQFTADFQEMTEKFQTFMNLGVHPGADEVQKLVAEHYAFVKQFWTPNQEAYKSLAMMYILPSPYRDHYESVQVGLGQYHYDAIVLWANQNL